MPKLRGTAARTVRDGFAETLAYTKFPPEHWRRIRTNNVIERIKREIRGTRVVGTFPDGNSALMLVTARLKYIVEHEWGKRRYLDMSKLEEMDELKEKAEGKKRKGPRTAKPICERILTVPLGNITRELLEFKTIQRFVVVTHRNTIQQEKQLLFCKQYVNRS